MRPKRNLIERRSLIGGEQYPEVGWRDAWPRPIGADADRVSSPIRADGPANLLAPAKVADIAFDRTRGLQQNRSRSAGP
jgi:hypothetical protein